MNWNIWLPILIPIISAFAFWAYRHPETFHRVYYAILALLIIFMIFYFVWNYAIYRATLLVIHECGPDQSEIFQGMNLSAYWLAIGTGMMIYITVLRQLPILMGRPKEKD